MKLLRILVFLSFATATVTDIDGNVYETNDTTQDIIRFIISIAAIYGAGVVSWFGGDFIANMIGIEKYAKHIGVVIMLLSLWIILTSMGFLGN